VLKKVVLRVIKPVRCTSSLAAAFCAVTVSDYDKH
jgi:hypothetical protein